MSPRLSSLFALAALPFLSACSTTPPEGAAPKSAPVPAPPASPKPTPSPAVAVEPKESWSDTRTAPAGESFPAAHGDFKAQPVSVTVRGLPDHAAVRVRFKLIIKGGWDGNNAVWGPDLLGCRVRDGEQLFLTSFSNIGAESPYYTQSFPDDYPWANHYAFTGGEPLSGEPFRKPEPLYEAAIADSVYAFDIVFPHAGERITLDFAPLFTDPASDRQTWAVAAFSCEAAPDPAPLSAEVMDELWDEMADSDSIKGVAAMWRFVAAGATAETFLLERADALPEGPSEEDYNTPAGLRLMRLQRALRIIGTKRTVAASNNLLWRKIPRHPTCGDNVSP